MYCILYGFTINITILGGDTKPLEASVATLKDLMQCGGRLGSVAGFREGACREMQDGESALTKARDAVLEWQKRQEATCTGVVLPDSVRTVLEATPIAAAAPIQVAAVAVVAPKPKSVANANSNGKGKSEGMCTLGKGKHKVYKQTRYRAGKKPPRSNKQSRLRPLPPNLRVVTDVHDLHRVSNVSLTCCLYVCMFVYIHYLQDDVCVVLYVQQQRMGKEPIDISPTSRVKTSRLRV